MPLTLLLVLHTRNNTDGNKLVTFSGIALYYGDLYYIIKILFSSSRSPCLLGWKDLLDMQGTGGEGGEQYRHQEISGGYSGEEGGGEEGGRLVMLFVCECMNVCCDQSGLYPRPTHVQKVQFSFIKMYYINNVHVFMCSSKVILLHVLKFKIAATLDARTHGDIIFIVTLLMRSWGSTVNCTLEGRREEGVGVERSSLDRSQAPMPPSSPVKSSSQAPMPPPSPVKFSSQAPMPPPSPVKSFTNLFMND